MISNEFYYMDEIFGRKETLVDFWWKYKLVQTLKKTIWMFLRKLKAELPYDLVIPYIETVYIYMWNTYLEYIFMCGIYVCVLEYMYIYIHTHI